MSVSSSNYIWTTSDNVLKLTLFATATKDEANNRSVIKVKGQLWRTGTTATYDYNNTSRLRFKADGVTKVDYSTFEWYAATATNGKDGYIRKDSSSGQYEFQFYVTHDSDGTKQIDLQMIFTPGNTEGTSYLVGGNDYIVNINNFTLETIPRASVITGINGFNLEDAFSVTLTKYSASFTDTLVIKYGTTTIKTIIGYGSGNAINLSDTELLTAYSAMGIDRSGTFTFQMTTKEGTAIIGTDSATATGTAAGTMYVSIAGTWKRALPHRNIGGTWKRCVGLNNVNGTWKRGIG